MYEWVQRQRPGRVAVDPAPARQGDVGAARVRQVDRRQPVAGRAVRGPHGRQALRAARRARRPATRRRCACDRADRRDRPRRPAQRGATDFQRQAVGHAVRALRGPPAHRPHPPGAGPRHRPRHADRRRRRARRHRRAPGCSCTPPGSSSTTRPDGPLDLAADRPAELRPGARRRRLPTAPPIAARWWPTRPGRCCSTRPTPTPTSGSIATTTASRRSGSNASATWPSPSTTTTSSTPLAPTTWLDAWNDDARPAGRLRAAPAPKGGGGGPARLVQRRGAAAVRGHRARAVAT